MNNQPPVSPSAHPSASGANQLDLHLNTSSLNTTYSNYFRASGSAEELILDFGLDAHRHSGDDTEPIIMLQRLVLTWGHAQQLARMLHNLIQHHEKTHAPLANASRPPNPPT